MHRAQEQVRDFMRAMGQPTPEKARVGLEVSRLELRLNLILEEAHELVEASGGVVLNTSPGYGSRRGKGYLLSCVAGTNDPVEQIDAMCDLLYVVYGKAVEMGIDIEPFFEIVHASNMKKGSGKVREDGKKLKPDGWVPPTVAIEDEMYRQLKAAK